MDVFVVHRLPRCAPMKSLTIFKHIFLKDVRDKQLLERELERMQRQKAHPFWFWTTYLGP